MTGKEIQRVAAAVLCIALAAGCADQQVTQPSGPDPEPAQLVVVSGDAQEALAGQQLPNPLVVRVTNAQGLPAAGQLVNFRVTSGGGSVYGGAALTNSQGIAQERWTMGTAGVPQTLEARAVSSETGAPLVFGTFRATSRATVAVASVAVSPATASVARGATTPLTATVRDAAGAVLTGRTVTWASGNSAVATVSATGVVTGVAAGSATITATSEGRSGTATVTVTAPAPTPTPTPPPPGLWANEPAGMTLASEFGFDRLDGAWRYRAANASARIVTDETAPTPNKTAVEFVYPLGFTGGGYAPATMYAPSPFPDANGARNVRELYWGFVWKANAEWQNHESNINKLGYGWLNEAATFGLTWHWGSVSIGGRQVSKMVSLFEGGRYYHFNTPEATSLEPGRWYQVELYFRPSSAAGRADGVVRIWVNGVLMANHTAATTTPGYISNLYFSPTWGGSGQTAKRREDHIRVSRVRVSTR